jgi:hypothetical protein
MVERRNRPRQYRCNPPNWRYADDWRSAFRRGAIDAMRGALREIDDPHAWAVLVQLCDRYDPDGYELARGGW